MTEPTAPPAPKPPHVNVFAKETDFLAHYERARKIARFSPNHVKTYDGDDLLGVPVTGHDGAVVKEAGRVVWLRRPISGYVPADDGTEAWEPVPFLAPHLQSTLRPEPTEGGGVPLVAMRVTPEVRIEMLKQLPIRVRTLSIELTIIGGATLRKQSADALSAQCEPLVRNWYPLHVKAEREWWTTDPVEREPGVITTGLIIRFRANHELVDLDTR